MLPFSNKRQVLEACIRSNIAYLSPLNMKKLWLYQNQHYERTKLIDFERKFPNLKIKNTVEHPLKNVTDEPIFIHVSHGAKAYSWKKDRTLFFTFRGLNGVDWHDLKAICDLRPYKTKFGYVQRGYWMYMNKILPDILNQIDYHLQDINTIDLTGHSLGATMSAIAGINLANAFKDSGVHGVHIRCNVFGGPKICDKEFSDSFHELVPDSSHTIITKDPIPQVMNGFQHCIKKFNYIDSRNITEDLQFTGDAYFQRYHACYRYITILESDIY